MSDMPTTLSNLFQLYREELGYGFMATLLALLRHLHEGTPLRKWFFDSAICGFLAMGADQIMKWMEMPQEAGYFAAIFIGVFGYRVVMNILQVKIPIIGGINVSTEPKK